MSDSSRLKIKIANYQKNSIVYVDGRETNDVFYIIISGVVSINYEAKDDEEVNNEIVQSGDFFGVISTMANTPRMNTAMTLTDVRAMVVEKDNYSQLIKENPTIAIKIIRQFSYKMRLLNEELAKHSLADESKIDIESMVNIAKFYMTDNNFPIVNYICNRYMQVAANGESFSLMKEMFLRSEKFVKKKPEENNSNKKIAVAEKGEMIFCEGEPGDSLYIIQHGEVRIDRIANNRLQMLAMLREGDIFGEMALLEDKPRSASAIAASDCKMMVISRQNFKTMTASQPQIIYRLTQILSERIWFVHKQVANSQIKNILYRFYDALWILYQKSKNEKKLDVVLDLGYQELIAFTAVATSEGNEWSKKLLADPNIDLIDNKFIIKKIDELERQVRYHKRIE